MRAEAVEPEPGAVVEPRVMEALGRGVVAVPRPDGGVFVSWRLLGTEPSDTAFDVFRITEDGSSVQLNPQRLTGGTNFTDTEADRSGALTYRVSPRAVGEAEAAGPSGDAVVLAGVEDSFLTLPLQALEGYYVHLAWVGDLDGNGEYDFVVDRIPEKKGTPKLEAYLRDGTFLWRFDAGANSDRREGAGVNDVGPASISGFGNVAGYRDNDNVTVYDLDSDGRAEVAVRTAAGAVFGDGQTLASERFDDQYISILDGMTGQELARQPVVNRQRGIGPVSGHMGVAYLDGERPSLVFKSENRGRGRTFNLTVSAWDYRQGALSSRWVWERGRKHAPIFHQIRFADVDGDGRDEVCDGGYVLDDDGTVLYVIDALTHGDRFHIGDLDPDRPGLEGFGVQQDNPSRLGAYYYDAANGKLLREHFPPVAKDVGRGTTADLDPGHRGYEYWASMAPGDGEDAYGVFNAPSGQLVIPHAQQPVPNFRIWWDGDTLSELLDRTHVLKWDITEHKTRRLLDAGRQGAVHSWRNAPPLYGDIMGDWREEVVLESADHSQLMIFTTTIPSDVSLYTLPHNPLYRNDMTTRGYYQSNMVDYYLGDGMSSPPLPRIRTAATQSER